LVEFAFFFHSSSSEEANYKGLLFEFSTSLSSFEYTMRLTCVTPFYVLEVSTTHQIDRFGEYPTELLFRPWSA